jgi:hypothetical protein
MKKQAVEVYEQPVNSLDVMTHGEVLEPVRPNQQETADIALQWMKRVNEILSQFLFSYFVD